MSITFAEVSFADEGTHTGSSRPLWAVIRTTTSVASFLLADADGHRGQCRLRRRRCMSEAMHVVHCPLQTLTGSTQLTHDCLYVFKLLCKLVLEVRMDSLLDRATERTQKIRSSDA